MSELIEISIELLNYMKHHPIINIGTLGSVSHGKSTLVSMLTGTKTQRHSTEQIRNITIKPGYANLKIWQDEDTFEFITTNSEIYEMEGFRLVHHISFVDCPGHQELIQVMLGSVSLMKGAIVVVSAAEDIKTAKQLTQHLAAAKLAKLENLIVLFNKLDLVSKSKAIERKEDLDELLTRLGIKPKITIPTALNKRIGYQNIIKSILEIFPPKLDENKEAPLFRILRSFDINKPGINWNEIQGGVLGGSLLTGKLEVGDKIVIKPGNFQKKSDGSWIMKPIETIIKSIKTEKENIINTHPGGLVGFGTDIDPFYCKDEKLEGQVLGLPGQLPPVYYEIKINITLTEDFDGKWNPKVNDSIYLQIGNINTKATLTNINESIFTFKLTKPCCIMDNDLILICVDSEGNLFRIVGYGNFISRDSIFINE
jgi:translation initiation factor 2 subunit 3